MRSHTTGRNQNNAARRKNLMAKFTQPSARRIRGAKSARSIDLGLSVSANSERDAKQVFRCVLSRVWRFDP